MMLQKKIIFGPLLCLMIPFLLYGQSKRDTLYYEIQPEMIDSAGIHHVHMQGMDYYQISIQLKKEYWTKYEHLTENNIGNILAVTYKDKIISPSSPVIQAKIKKGRFPLGPFENRERARKVMQHILKKDE